MSNFRLNVDELITFSLCFDLAICDQARSLAQQSLKNSQQTGSKAKETYPISFGEPTRTPVVCSQAGKQRLHEEVAGRFCTSSRDCPLLLLRCVCVYSVPLQWMCFDACPVHACLPFVAERIAAVSPNAKIIIMVRVIH